MEAFVTPTTLAELQPRYRQLTGERAFLADGGISRREKKRVGIIDATLAAFKAVFPDFDPKKDYSIPIEAGIEPGEGPATLSQIKALADSIPISSLGPQGSAQPMLTDTGATTGTDKKTLLGLGAVALIGIVAVFFFFRK